MSIFGWILFGFIVGLIARVLMPGRDPLGLIGTTVLAIVGALCAGWVGQALGFYATNDGAGFASATCGAIMVLAIYYGVTGNKRFQPDRRVRETGATRRSVPPRETKKSA